MTFVDSAEKIQFIKRRPHMLFTENRRWRRRLTGGSRQNQRRSGFYFVLRGNCQNTSKNKINGNQKIMQASHTTVEKQPNPEKQNVQDAFAVNRQSADGASVDFSWQGYQQDASHFNSDVDRRV